MSEHARTITESHFEYLADRTIGDDAFLRDLKAAAERERIPRIWISAEQAAFFEILVRAVGAREVVEVGTLAGYAAIRFARGMGPQGRVRTIELAPQHAAFASAWIERSDVADRIEVHQGDARLVLREFESNSADVVFIDADKEGYPHYLDEALRIVRLGGLVLVDNAFAFGNVLDTTSQDPEVSAIREFNDALAAHPALRSIIVPFGDGCWMGVKVATP